MLEFFMVFERWGSLIPLVGGVYATLLGHGILPRKPRDPAAWADWRQRHGRTMRISGPFIALCGAVALALALTSGPSPLPARRVFVEFQKANAARQERGDSPPSAAEFLADLRRIDVRHAPVDLQAALAEYISALDEGLKALEAGRPTASADARMSEARQKLLSLESIYFDR